MGKRIFLVVINDRHIEPMSVRGLTRSLRNYIQGALTGWGRLNNAGHPLFNIEDRDIYVQPIEKMPSELQASVRPFDPTLPLSDGGTT